MLQQTIVLIMLAACSREDILHRRIYLRWLMYFTIAGILCFLAFAKQPFIMLLFGIAPGVAVFLYSGLSRGSIGQGDGILLMALGIYLGAAAAVRIFLYAVFISAFYAIYLYFGKKKGKEYEMPFVPFLLVAFLADILLREW